MTNDPVNYVRQGALIASALIMIQQTEITCPKVSEQWNRLYRQTSAQLYGVNVKLAQVQNNTTPLFCDLTESR